MSVYLLLTLFLVIPQSSKANTFLEDFLQNRNDYVNVFDCHKTDSVLKQFLISLAKHKMIGYYDQLINLKFNEKDFIIIIFKDNEKCKKLLNEFNSLNLLNYPHKILILTEDKEKLSKQLLNYSMFSSSEIVVAEEFKDGNINLLKVYKMFANSSLEWENYGFWSQKFGLNLSILKDSTTHQRRCNFRGAKFKIALIMEDERSFQHFDDFKFPWVDVHTKENIGSIRRALEYCKITPEFVRVNNYEHLYEENDDFLFTATAPYMTEELLKKISFVRIQNSPKVCYLIKRPPKSYVITIFTNAFDSSVWLAIIICLILLAICLYGILNVEGQREAIKFRDTFNAFDMALIALEAVCQQGASIDPRSYSARILEVLMFTAFMFLYVSYSANILVLLQSTTTIRSVDDLRELKFKIGGMNTSSMKHYHSDIGEDLYRRSINSSGVYSIQEGLERVKDGLFAFYLESHYSYPYIKESYTDYETCGLQQVGESFETRLGFAGFNKRSPYAELFKVVFLKMEQLGFQTRHFKRYFRKPQCYSPGSSFDTVGIPETYQAILVIALGVILAILILLAEIFAAKFAERKNQKKKLNVTFNIND